MKYNMDTAGALLPLAREACFGPRLRHFYTRDLLCLGSKVFPKRFVESGQCKQYTPKRAQSRPCDSSRASRTPSAAYLRPAAAPGPRPGRPAPRPASSRGLSAPPARQGGLFTQPLAEVPEGLSPIHRAPHRRARRDAQGGSAPRRGRRRRVGRRHVTVQSTYEAYRVCVTLYGTPSHQSDAVPALEGACKCPESARRARAPSSFWSSVFLSPLLEVQRRQ